MMIQSGQMEGTKENDVSNTLYAQTLVDTFREPLLVLDAEFQILASNEAFCAFFGFSEARISGQKILELDHPEWDFSRLEELLQDMLPLQKKVYDYPLRNHGNFSDSLVNASLLERDREPMILLSFKVEIKPAVSKKKNLYLRSIRNILAHVPAMICTLRGPEHIFELANDKYFQLIGYRDIIGKRVRDVLPEVENQGFIQILDEVYETGVPYVGEEVLLKLKQPDGKTKDSYLDFLYEPTVNSKGKVDGIFAHALDVTERVLARKKLERNQENLRNLIDAVPSLIWMTDREGNAVYMNKNWYSYTGMNTEESKGFGWLGLVHPDDRKRAEEIAEKAHKKEESLSVSYRMRHKSGQYRWIIDTGRPRYSLEGAYEGMIGTVVDVHEEKIKEQLILDSEHRLRSIVKEATVATAVYTGKEMKIDIANDAMLHLWGKNRSVIGKTLRQALPELQGQPFFDILQEVFTTGKTYWGKEDKVKLFIDDELRTGYYNFTYKPLRNDKGEIYGILNMAVDVTETVIARKLEEESHARFKQMADLMPEKVVKTDVNGKPIYFNKGWIDYTGWSVEELKKEGLAPLIHPEDRKEYIRRWEACLNTGGSFEMEFRCLHKSGQYQWHLSRGEAVRDKEGQIDRWIATTTEIQKLKEEEKRKEDFLKMVSHELKTPVTSMKGYVQLLLSLLDKSEDAPANSLPLKPSLERIDNQIVRLTRLISEMLDLSRLEENKLELEKELFDLNDLVVQTVQDIRLTNTQHHIEVHHETQARVFADKDRIGQVLINFITNAIKYSPDSQEVEIDIFKRDADKVGVCVRDKGIGIDKKNLKKIFKRFYRIGGKSEETYSGFGIGLYLANEIIERHDGHIEVESEKGRGSQFTFFLTIASESGE